MNWPKFTYIYVRRINLRCNKDFDRLNDFITGCSEQKQNLLDVLPQNLYLN